MFKKISLWWRSRKQPKIWALRDSHSYTWSKVVSYSKPAGMYSWAVVGPFRSEVDCEEYCDRQNIAMTNHIRFYSSDYVLQKKNKKSSTE